MNYVSALAIVLGIASGAISIYEFIKKGSWRQGITFSVAAVVLLIAAVVVANLPPYGSGVPTALNSSTPRSGISVTPVPTTPTPQSTPSLSPTPAPKPGDVLCQANASTGWNGWGASGEWQISNGELVNTGTGLGGPPTIAAPCQLGTNNYSVEAKIQVVHWPFSQVAQFAIVVRGGVSSEGYPQGYTVGMIINGNGFTAEHAAAISKSPGDFMQTLKYAPYNLDNQFHDYFVEVKGNMIMFSIDGKTLLTVTDNTFPSGDQVGLWSENTELTISSIKIIAL